MNFATFPLNELYELCEQTLHTYSVITQKIVQWWMYKTAHLKLFSLHIQWNRIKSLLYK